MLTLRGDKFVYTPHLLHQNRQTPQNYMDRVDAGGTNSNTLPGQISIYLTYGQRVFTSPRPTTSKVAAGNESQQKYGANQFITLSGHFSTFSTKVLVPEGPNVNTSLGQIGI